MTEQYKHYIKAFSQSLSHVNDSKTWLIFSNTIRRYFKN
jgi:hypothetical protein